MLQRDVAEGRRLRLLDADPELASLLDGEALERARHDLTVRWRVLGRGLWDVGRLNDASCANVGLLVLDGVVAREVVIGGEVSSELLGAGDLIRPWGADAGGGLVDEEVRWNVLAEGRVAILDAAFTAQSAAFPGVIAMLLERVEARARRLATAKAIAQLTRVDHRLLAIFRQLGERWGKVTAHGVLLPLCLSHRTLGELIGARRPTVSTAAAALARSGELTRRPDGSWLLRDRELAASVAASPASVAQRRRLIALAS